MSLLVAVQALAFVAVYGATDRNARNQIGGELASSARVGAQLVDDRIQGLIQAAGLVSGDFAFKRAYALRHERTMVSALNNLMSRISADVAMLTEKDRSLIASSVDVGATGDTFRFATLIEAAIDSPATTAAAIEFIDGRPVQLVVVPLRAPVPVAWIVLGFVLDDGLARQLQSLTRDEVSLVHKEGDRWVSYGSTLAAPLRADLTVQLAQAAWNYDEAFDLDLAGDTYLTRIAGLGGQGAATLAVVLQRPLGDALAPYFRLQILLAALAGIALVISIMGAGLIAQSVTRPLQRLTEAIRRVGEGDYHGPVEFRQQDEIGELATAFNVMTVGLAERDRVRDLLGKVVSPQIASELLGHDVELGGEERTVTVLFADIRDFTALSENLTARELLALLNEYLTEMSDVIEANGGVVDKYIGDAVMALFGAPVAQPDAAACAIRAALGMDAALEALNGRLASRGQRQLDFGVGINTAEVVAGNMGSARRLNYTVIGDGVNVASRVEGLTRVYGVHVIVTESVRAGAGGFVYRELDRVQVKGRAAPLRIFEPLGETGALPDESLARLERWHEALTHYRNRDWEDAADLLAGLLKGEPGSPLYELYRERIAHLRQTPPGPGWNGVYIFREK